MKMLELLISLSGLIVSGFAALAGAYAGQWNAATFFLILAIVSKLNIDETLKSND